MASCRLLCACGAKFLSSTAFVEEIEKNSVDSPQPINAVEDRKKQKFHTKLERKKIVGRATSKP